MSPALMTRWPRALVHIDGDAFFASVEQAVKPWLKGKPVVTGKERNIVAAASYEAKAFGVRRGVELWEAKKMCPSLIVLPTDYETVSLFSKRLHDIMRRYTPIVEEYGIDEGFADITGLRRLHHASYEQIAARMQEDIHRELDITVSVGLSISKVLTKLASKKDKPAGFVTISARDREATLRDVPIADIWNIGPNTASLLQAHGMPTALSFASCPEEKIDRLLHKPGKEIWQELNGQSVLQITTDVKENYQSISKTKTFTPPSADSAFVFAQLMKNVENAFIKARRYDQAAGRLVVFLKRQDHGVGAVEAKLSRATAYPREVSEVCRQLFEQLFLTGTKYRATGVILTHLTAAQPLQPSLFEDLVKIQKTVRLYKALDELREKYGKHVLHSAGTLAAQRTQHQTERGDTPYRKTVLLAGESKRRRLPLPLLARPAN